MFSVKDLKDLVVPEGELYCCWLGQGGFAYKNSEGGIMFVDPYLSNSVERMDGSKWKRLPSIPIRPEEAVADVLLCTHADPDHADPDTVPEIIAGCLKTVLVGPGSVGKAAEKWGVDMSRFTLMERGGYIKIADFKIYGVYAKHTEDSIGVVILTDDISIYLTGDTLYTDVLGTDLPVAPDVFITVINGRMGNMDASEAMQVAARTKAGFVIPCHYGMFERNSADPNEFIRIMEDNVPSAKVFKLEHDMCFSISKKINNINIKFI